MSSQHIDNAQQDSNQIQNKENQELEGTEDIQINNVQENKSEQITEENPSNKGDQEVEENSFEDIEEEVEEEIPEEELEEAKKQWEQEQERLKEQGQQLEQDFSGKRKVLKIVKKRKENNDNEVNPLVKSQLQNDNNVISYILESLEDKLDKFTNENWKNEYNENIRNFIENEDKIKMFIWCEQESLGFSHEPPDFDENSYDTDFAYFLKIPTNENRYIVNKINPKESIIVGTIKPNYRKGLLSQMNLKFIPKFHRETSWPENVKNEFLTQLHKFMATLTQVSFAQEGFTELYIPIEELDNLEEAQQDKDLIQRLETTLIHWNSQIKDVVNNQDSQHDQDNAGPLDEIAYWRLRKNNLSYIDEQLEKKELKKIIYILNQVDSSYVKNFEELTKHIKTGSIEADDNLLFLKSLYEPCKKLQEASPKEIPSILPGLLHRVRMIWEKSKYYNTSERIQGLLHKISNEIIKRCKDQINIKDMLDGDVEKCMEDLQSSIECGKQWRKIYEKTAQVIAKRNKQNKWDFNLNSIFPQVDAFVQRCVELKEICEGQLQFARKGSDNSLPQLGGARGPEIINILEEIKISFRKNLEKIRGSDQDKILDVKASKWHDEFGAFKNSMKDLDVMYENIIKYAFDSVTTVQQGVEMLEAFDYLAKRESIKAAVRKKAQDVLNLFVSELDSTKSEFDNIKKEIIIPITHGKYSGQAIWIASLIHRIEKMKDWIDKMHFIDENQKKSSLEKYDNYYQTYRHAINQKLKEWKEENKDIEESNIGQRLDKPILARIDENDSTVRNQIFRSRPGHLESNYDKQLQKLIREVISWKKLMTLSVSIPNYADEISMMHKETSRVLREYVMLVVRDYNLIIDSQNDTEKKLFKQHLEVTEKVIASGLGKLKWSSKGVLETFVRDCRNSCEQIMKKLKIFKSNMQKIQGKCQEISVQMLIRIDKKRVYDIKHFEDEQEKYRINVQDKLKNTLEYIRKVLVETYIEEEFVFQRADIQKVWFKEVTRIDNLIEEALKKAVKISLLDLQKVIGEDQKQNPIPIFKLSVELVNQDLGFKPNQDYLIGMMRQTTTAIVEIIKDFRRMEQLLHEERKKRFEEAAIQQEKEKQNNMMPQMRSAINKPKIDLGIQFDQEKQKQESFYEAISKDDDVKKYTEKILANLQTTCEGLGDLLDPWKKSSWYWKQTSIKEKFAKTMVDRNDPISNLKTHIENFEIMQSGIQSGKTSDKSGCIVLDNTNIKTTLVDIMILWQNALLKAIEERACKDLNDLHQAFQTNTLNLAPTPLDLHQLKKNMDLWNKLNEEKPQTEEKLSPLEEKFKLLDEYSINLSEENQIRRNSLRELWAEFCIMLENIQQRNQKVFSELYYETMKNLEDFLKETGDNKLIFQGNAPFSNSGISCDKAFSILNEYKDISKQLRKREENMKFGVDLFKINYVPSADLEYVEKEIVQLEEVWQQKEQWNKKYEEIEKINFRFVNIDDLDEEGESFQRTIKLYPKEIQKWEVVMALKNDIEVFRNTLPLVKMLREPYMRERHWEKLQKHLGTLFDPDSESFNMEAVFNLNLNQNQDGVREVCEIAKEEYKIESALDRIEKKWQFLELEMEPYKKTYKVKRADDIFQVLEDHMSTLSAQKTTLFYESFKSTIEGWETALYNILECLEVLLMVQRQWIYLESIFASQQSDSDKMLIGDINKFQKVNQRINVIMGRLHDEKNIKKSLCIEGFLQELQAISHNLDESYKILYQLLELKRKDFPRFYFISNDDLFELLGNSKDSSRVNRHIKKCFEGIKKLEFNQINLGGGRGKQIETWEIVSMISPDGETVSFNNKVQCELGIEKWMREVEKMMQVTLRKKLSQCHSGSNLGLCDNIKRRDGMRWVDKWIQSWPGQLLITALAIFWTDEIERTLNNLVNNEKADKNKIWKFCKDQKKNFIDELTKLVRRASSETERFKLVALITIEVHSRDIVEHLFKNCNQPQSFEWTKQLRFYSTQAGEGFDCVIKQTNTETVYGFEYQGNNGRLVVTNLTDRCYITLTTAMHLKKGGAPQGPAGTGKTETVKDLGKGLAKFVVVFNCSEGLDAKSLERIFSGLCQTGGWGCFDEFNRIEVEVLSVVAQQVYTIFNALKLCPEITNFQFEGNGIPLNDQTAIFITMNPGYAGRSELPDNLKSLFRPISMMVPESSVICEILLQSEGFKFGKYLSGKMVTLYNLMQNQLSKQGHYDFGLRAIKSVLICAGLIRRLKSDSIPTFGSGGKDKDRDRELEHQEQTIEQMILMQAIKDMNMPKFISDDIVLFNALFNDLFPNIDLPDNTNQVLTDAIESVMKIERIQPHPFMIQKIIQLYDTKNTRHGNMLVGSTCSGKSTTWKLLQKSLTFLNKSDPETYPQVKVEILNPKAISIGELYGIFEPISMEWFEGVLSSMMSRLCKDESEDQRWMILDGPVDTLWIESMNTVLDDNKVLTLLNGDRISLPSQMGLIFEVDSLSEASPATVSRCGMVYLDINELGWEPYAVSWVDQFKDEQLKEFLAEQFEKWVPKILRAKKQHCQELVSTNETAIIMSFCSLLKGFSQEDVLLNFDQPNKSDLYWNLLEKWFAFTLIWTVGATVNEQGRNIFDQQLREIESIFPHVNTVYDYYINNDKNEWGLWEDKLGQTVWKPPNGTPDNPPPFHKMFVPTVDTIRNKNIIQTLVKYKINLLTIGITGTGKTALLNGILQELDDSYAYINIIFSAQTTSLKTQEIIESKLIRRTKKMVPDGKKLVIFIDDFNMPKKESFGAQPPLELIRQWMDYGGWFDRNNREIFKLIEDVQFMTAMGPPGGGRAEISKRIQSKFALLNFTFPTDKQAQKIFQSILAFKFQNFEEEIKPLSEFLAQATLYLFKSIQETFLPTPAKSHYVFNLRDMSKLIQGIYQINRFYCDNKITVFRVWVHECLRIFHDRLIDSNDRAQLKKLIGDQLELLLQSNMKECTNENEEDTIFVDFFDESGKNVYQEIGYKDRVNLKKFIDEKLKECNEKTRNSVDIVLFMEAVSYMCKIYRIMKLSKGHGMLVGEGGSGRHSLTKLAAFIAEYKVWQIEIHKNYRLKDFREDIKRWAEEAGLKDQSGVFIFSDNEAINESFLEDLNNILTVGEIPNLFSKEDQANIKDKIKKEYYRFNDLEKDQKVSEEDLIDFFFSRIQGNFHIMFCMSKTSDNLRNMIRMYPGLVNNTTLIWFMSWPEEALIEVAQKYLGEIKIEENLKEKIAGYFGIAHTTVLHYAEKMQQELRRLYYVTPTNYIELVRGYNDLLEEKQREIGVEINKLGLGLEKLAEAAENSEELNKQLNVSQIELSKKSKDCEDLMIKIETDTLNANENQKEVERKTLQLDKEKEAIEALAREAQADLERAEPVLRAAEEGLENLKKDKLAEIKAYNKPPAEVNVVMSVIMTILGKDPSWSSAKKELADPNFLQKLKHYDKDNMSQNTIKKIEKYTHKPEMTRENVGSISEAAGSMWDWVLAMEQYAKAFKDIEPKRKKVNLLREKLQKSEDELSQLRQNFVVLKEKIQKLNDNLIKYKNDMEKYQEETNMLQIKLERADKLINGLASTKEGWAERKKQLEKKYEYLVGDSLVSAAFLSYAGPFPSEYRDKLLNEVLLKSVKSYKILVSKDYTFSEFLAKPTDFLKWTFQGLPDDNFSRDNGVLLTKGRRFPLMIDPQIQANKWVKKMEKEMERENKQSNQLIVLDPQSENFLIQIERAISQGTAVLLQNVDEELDSSIVPLLNKQIKKVAGKLMIILGEKEILYNPNFRFYITTKLHNPKYKAEVSTRVTLVNFTVKEKGLEEQLVSVVIHEMDKNLEKTRTELILKKSSNEIKLKQLDDDILRILQEIKGSLVDDENLIKTLQSSKEVEDDVKQQIEHSATAMRKTIAARENYRPLAKIASKLFFIVNDFSYLDNMYQFSLDTYRQLFAWNIDNWLKNHLNTSDQPQEKLNNIADQFKKDIYQYTCRGLFEKDKLLLSLQMAVNLSEDIDINEYSFFLRGGQTINRKGQPPNPNPDWISLQAWDMICELEKMPNFNGIVGAFVHNQTEWKRWYMSATPESDSLPGKWEQNCDSLKKMILLKTIRPDRVLFAAGTFIQEKLGEYYVNPPQVKIEKIFEDSKKTMPVLFILASGVDPFPQLEQFARSKDRHKHLFQVALGQGQARKAKEKIGDAKKNGDWIYLANCHLSLSFLKELERIIEKLENEEIDENFRLFMSSNPHSKFPISILQKCIKVTTEPPKGLRANMVRLYNQMNDDKFVNVFGKSTTMAEKLKNYKKLLFSLCWFHSIIIERKKFNSLGWNISYDFNDSDWDTSDRILKIYLDQTIEKGGEQGKSIQWDAIKFLIAEVTYGGRVTDDWDRRLLITYANELFSEKVIQTEKFKLANPNLPYIIPDDASLKDAPGSKTDKTGNSNSYVKKIVDYLDRFPLKDRPEAFGQHINAEISSQIADTNSLIDSIISLEPKTFQAGQQSRESRVAEIIKGLLEIIPDYIDMGMVIETIHPEDSHPLKIVLLQEIDRYNKLLLRVKESLIKLDQGIHGFVLISEDLEQIMDSLFENKVPSSWKFCYHSLKPLQSWMQDLILRIEQLQNWAFKGQPNVFWISGFSYPTGFTTALFQSSARKLNISIDNFGWEFIFFPMDTNISSPAKEGAYISGLFLEGAKWDYDKGFLMDAEPMKLHYEMPVIHFKPVITEGKLKQKKGINYYTCPTYMYPIRTGTRENPSYMFSVQLPCKPNITGQIDTEFWIKRGVALLMSLNN